MRSNFNLFLRAIIFYYNVYMQEEAKCNRTKGTYLYFFTIKYSRKPTLNKTISAVVNNITKYKTYIYLLHF